MEIKKTNKRFIAGILALAMMVTLIGIIYGVPLSMLGAGDPTPETAFTTVDDGSGGLEITKYISTQNPNYPDVVIPGTINGKKVTSIGRNVFYYDYINSVIIPNSVKTLGDLSFGYSHITSVTIPDSVTSIGESAFVQNELTEVIIPDSVTSIGGGAFTFNKLKSVTISEGVKSIGWGAFSLNKLQSVTIPNSVTSIGDGAFQGNKLKSVTIPDGVTNIEYRAFADNQLKSVTIPNSVTSIGKEAFKNNKLTSVPPLPSSVTTVGTEAFAQQTPSLPYRLEGGNYICKFTDDVDMSKVTLPADSKFMIDTGKREATSTIKTNLTYNYNVTYGTSGTSVMTVTAIPLDAQFTVRFLDFDGNEMKTEQVTNGGFANAPAPPTLPPGYTFIGWDPDISEPITEHTDFRVQYTRQIPVATNFIYTKPANLTYDKTGKIPTVTPTATGMGAVTIKYQQKNTGIDYEPIIEQAPVNVGTYQVYIDVAEGKDFTRDYNLTYYTWNFTILPADLPTPPVHPTDLTGTVGKKLADVVGSMDVTGGIWRWDDPITPVGTTIGKSSFPATFTPTDTNYKPFTDTLEVMVKPAPTLSHFTYTPPSSSTYDKTAKQADVKTSEPGMGTFSVKYTRISKARSASTTSTPPTDAGTYGVSIDVGVGTTYGAITLTDPAWNFTISPASLPTPPVQPTELKAFEGQTLKDVKEGMKVTDGEWRWDDPSTPVGGAGPRSFPATFAPTDTNYQTFGASLSVQVSTPTPGGGTNDPSNPGGSGGSWGPDGSWIPDGLQDFLATGDVMNETLIYGLVAFLVVSGIGLYTVISKRKSK